VLADDTREYWCKALNNGQHERVPINEQIVARLGELIGVAVCEPMLVWIPTALVGTEFAPGLFLEEGWVHGSLAVVGVIETHGLDHRLEDDNARRHAGFFALHDWLTGSDDQWLVETGQENRYHSHDHGHYFTPPGAAWTCQTLSAPDDPCELGHDPTNLDHEELERLASALEALSEEEIWAALENIPEAWPIPDQDLECVARLADERRQPVADRLRSISNTIAGVTP
jgi:hypothetical protein